MWGDNDAWIPVENAKLFAEKIPNVKVDIMKDTGHIPMEERPEESLKLFVDFKNPIFKMLLPKSTIKFFKDLKQNNNRDWFALNKAHFKEIENQVKTFGNEIKNKLNEHDNIDRFKLLEYMRCKVFKGQNSI